LPFQGNTATHSARGKNSVKINGLTKADFATRARSDSRAYLIVFLASDYAKNITGQVFVSDGGLTAK